MIANRRFKLDSTGVTRRDEKWSEKEKACVTCVCTRRRAPAWQCGSLVGRRRDLLRLPSSCCCLRGGTSVRLDGRRTRLSGVRLGRKWRWKRSEARRTLEEDEALDSVPLDSIVTGFATACWHVAADPSGFQVTCLPASALSSNVLISAFSASFGQMNNLLFGQTN